MNTDIKQWVDNWQRTGPLLEQLEAQELRANHYDDGLKNFLPMLRWACEHAEPRETSGLVEQQRLFAKLRSQGQAKTP